MAWGGHAAMSEGGLGLVHLASDILHLLAAGVWISALLCLAFLLSIPLRRITAQHAELSHRALVSFGLVGTMVVTILIISGLVNSWLLVGLGGVTSLPSTAYGQLLIAKLLLFGIMLGLAALNRYRMTPALRAAIGRGDIIAAVRGLRMSLAVETACALIILILVAWLSSLSPPAASL